jgi:hypothetical protein
MRLEIGDKIYCYKLVGEGLTLGKEYIITSVRTRSFNNGDYICILDENGNNWWFGQIGETECWTSWFISEKQWIRNNKLKEIGV